jgi:rubrerythrin
VEGGRWNKKVKGKDMPNAGEKPGAGMYRCKYCSYIVSLEDDEMLGQCPVCGALEWYRLDDEEGD